MVFVPDFCKFRNFRVLSPSLRVVFEISRNNASFYACQPWKGYEWNEFLYIYIYRIVSNLPWQLIRVNYVPTPFETAYETN